MLPLIYHIYLIQRVEHFFTHEYVPGLLLICVLCVCECVCAVHFVLCSISRVMLSAIDSRPCCVPRLIIRHSALQGSF